MVIGLLAITAIPTVIGVGQAISAQKKQNAAQSKEQEKFHLEAFMSFDDDEEPEEMGTGMLVDNKVRFQSHQPSQLTHVSCSSIFLMIESKATSSVDTTSSIQVKKVI